MSDYVDHETTAEERAAAALAYLRIMHGSPWHDLAEAHKRFDDILSILLDLPVFTVRGVDNPRVISGFERTKKYHDWVAETEALHGGKKWGEGWIG